MSRQINNDDADDFAAEVAGLMSATSRLASAERAMARGWDWQWVAGQLEQRPVTDEAAELAHLDAWLDLVLHRPPLGRAA